MVKIRLCWSLVRCKMPMISFSFFVLSYSWWNTDFEFVQTWNEETEWPEKHWMCLTKILDSWGLHDLIPLWCFCTGGLIKDEINILSSLKLTIRKLNVQKRVEILIILPLSLYHITKKSSYVLLSFLFMYLCTWVFFVCTLHLYVLHTKHFQTQTNGCTVKQIKTTTNININSASQQREYHTPHGGHCVMLVCDFNCGMHRKTHMERFTFYFKNWWWITAHMI